MSIATVMTILSIVNGLVSIAKNAPQVMQEARSLMDKVRPHIDATNDEAKAAFAALQAKLA